MPQDPNQLLRALERIKDTFDSTEVTQRKLRLLEQLSRRRQKSAAAVLRLHEVLCFLRAYPDSRALLKQVEAMLQAFSERSDLATHRQALTDSGIAGTTISYPFFWPMASWLAQTCPEQLHIDWENLASETKLLEWLPHLVPAGETAAMDEIVMPAREWIDHLRGPQVTDATFIVRRIQALAAAPTLREAIHDQLDLSYRLEPGQQTASRTLAQHRLPVTLQRAALQRHRPDLQQAAREQPRGVRVCSVREGQQLVDLARSAMLTRSRDLDVFSYGNPEDVRLVDFGDGLQFACIGFLPQRRLLLHSLYGFLTLKNGVPIGYVLASALFGYAGVAYNTFETFRGGEAAFVFGRVLAMAHFIFGAKSFSIDPYQLGYGNQEGLASGAWWFYYKLGFRPMNPDVRRVLQSELKKMKVRSQHRSSLATLEQLASDDMFFHLHASQWGKPFPPLEALSLGISRYLAKHAGADREAGLQDCAARARRILGVGSRRGWSANEKQAWQQWGPLVCTLPNVQKWSPTEKRQFVQVIRAKGGRHESDFVTLFDSHRKLRGAILRLAQREWDAL